MKNYYLNRKNLIEELDSRNKLEEELNDKLNTIDKLKFVVDASTIKSRLIELCNSIKDSIFNNQDDEIIFDDQLFISICEAPTIEDFIYYEIEKELKRQNKINRKRKGLISFLLRFINFKHNICSVYRRFILRFNLKNMSDESGSDNNITFFKSKLLFTLHSINYEKRRKRLLY